MLKLMGSTSACESTGAECDEMLVVAGEFERMTTDTTERGLESLICTALAGHPCDSSHIETEKPSDSGGFGLDCWPLLRL